MSLIHLNNKFKVVKEHSGGFLNPNLIFILQGGYNNMKNFSVSVAELIWPDKYDENGNLVEFEKPILPFQKVETINNSRIDRIHVSKSHNIIDYGIDSDVNWKNKLIWGDNKYVMSSLLKEYAGKIDLIYIDPPFGVGADFSFKAQIGDQEVTKEPSIIELKAYRDTWGKGVNSYLHMLYERLIIMRDLLSDSGSIYVHCDWRVSGYMRLLLDEIFGRECFLNDISWCYSGPGGAEKFFVRKHDNIFFYSKRKNSNKFNTQRIKHKSGIHNKGAFMGKQEDDSELLVKELEEKGKKLEDWWTDIYTADRKRSELLGYPTQKPEELLERIISAASDKMDLVADFFCGSGTTLAVAEKLGRRWIGCDLSRFAIHTSRKRLMDITGAKPFDILNMGKYERKYWQGITFNEKNDPSEKELISQYLKFILNLYHASPINGFNSIHGKKGTALVHVGAVDAPVTIDEVMSALQECKKVGRDELHVLGWEWEMGMKNLTNLQAKNHFGINLRLLSIPREVMDKRAVDAGDIQFFDLAFLETSVTREKGNKKTIKIQLINFAIPNTELIPEDVRKKITKWSDYIDYWAVDWNFTNDTFINQWQAYRTRKNRGIELETDWYEYKRNGKYKVVIKVVDIFGNDTSHLVGINI